MKCKTYTQEEMTESKNERCERLSHVFDEMGKCLAKSIDDSIMNPLNEKFMDEIKDLTIDEFTKKYNARRRNSFKNGGIPKGKNIKLPFPNPNQSVLSERQQQAVGIQLKNKDHNVP